MGAWRLVALHLLILGGAVSNIDHSRWYGRSIYFVVVDRFALDAEDESPMCGFVGDSSWTQWCGGSLKGVIRKLDYIQGMGFDAIWITPVVLQVDWSDRWKGSGYHGYWAADFWKIDPHYGTEDDLRVLSNELHKRQMLLMLDVVANHVGPVHSTDSILNLGEGLNDPSGDQFHQLGRSPNQTLNQYLDSPASVYTEVVGENNKTWYHCYTGNYTCPGYSENRVENGWFGDLGDLNHENPAIREYLKRWINHMVNKYELDGIRLDTASFMPHWFLAEFQQAAGVVILGEVVSYNLTFHSSYQTPLTGLLNTPPPMSWTQANDQTNDIWNPMYGDFRPFSHLLELQQTYPYTDLHLLGNYIDNHDSIRFLFMHYGDHVMLQNALVWCFFHHGIPIFYYGTEQPIVSTHFEQRRSMWFVPWDEESDAPYQITELYQFTGVLNALRKEYGLGNGGRHVTSLAVPVLVRREVFVFFRGDLLVAVASVQNWTTPRFCLQRNALPENWADACGTHVVKTVLGAAPDPQCDDARICFEIFGSRPAIFVITPPEWHSPFHFQFLVAVVISLIFMSMVPLCMMQVQRGLRLRQKAIEAKTSRTSDMRREDCNEIEIGHQS